MKLSVSLEIFTCFSFPKIPALVLEGISSGKSSGLDYAGGSEVKITVVLSGSVIDKSNNS